MIVGWLEMSGNTDSYTTFPWRKVIFLFSCIAVSLSSALDLGVRLKWGQMALVTLFHNSAATTESPLLLSVASSKSRKQNSNQQGAVTSCGCYLFTFRATQTSAKEGTEIQYLNQTPVERSEERLCISTKDGAHAGCVSVISVWIFYLCDIRTKQWYLILLLAFLWHYMVWTVHIFIAFLFLWHQVAIVSVLNERTDGLQGYKAFITYFICCLKWFVSICYSNMRLTEISGYMFFLPCLCHISLFSWQKSILILKFYVYVPSFRLLIPCHKLPVLSAILFK